MAFSFFDHIVFAGGGTGGHLFPGLAVAEVLGKMPGNLRMTFAGTGKDWERREVAAAGWKYVALPCHPAPQKITQAIPFFFRAFRDYVAASRFLRAENVLLVVGLGGYASAFVSLAAAHRQIPLVLLEQNVVPGRATQWLAKKADLVCTSFDETAAHLPDDCRIQCTGNPLRGGFEKLARKRAAHVPPVLLVLGGSRGSGTLNERVPRVLDRLREQLAGWRIVHQTGAADLSVTRLRYERFRLPAATVSFLENLPEVLAETELVISRAGGTSLAEFAAAGVPAVLIPNPHARDRHQQENAAFLGKAGAAAVVLEHLRGALFDQTLTRSLIPLLTDSLCRSRLAQAMSRLTRPGAASEVAERIWRELHRCATRSKSSAA
jgi:UDP-N-acetylglucosamine--N-acetylmuramyl-(pentapeptide) pyrophosphoryl-undecaprenol N-acetylglucosamine transferase